MKLIVCDNREASGELIATMLADAITSDPRMKLGLSAGKTSLVAYDELVNRHHEKGGFTFAHLTTFNTDEYVGLAPEDRRSTRFLMNKHLFRQVDIPREQTFVPRGDAADLEAECKAYDLLIEARGGLDLVVLGLGHNGHVGLNEPGSSPKSRTRLVDLTPSTLAAISGGERFRNLETTPSRAISMGMATILESRKVLLAVTGMGKAEAVHRMVEGRVGPGMPATLLTGHRDLTIVVDRDAASKLDSEHLAEADIR
jgi:glucosamine-6-phosphate deaminase